MKQTLIALAVALVTVQAQAQQWPITKYRSPISGNATYYQGAKIIGHTTVNPVTGSETYWPNQAHNYGSQSGCCYNRPFAEGAQIGRDLGTIFRALSGRQAR